MTRSVRRGRYERYKGGRYRVVGVARHSETKERLVVYQALYGEGRLWVRPLAMFRERLRINGKTRPRFRYLGR